MNSYFLGICPNSLCSPCGSLLTSSTTPMITYTAPTIRLPTDIERVER